MRRRRALDPEEEAAERASSGDDEFYDRTEEGQRRKARVREAAAVLSAESLYGSKVGTRGWLREYHAGWRTASRVVSMSLMHVMMHQPEPQ